MCKEVVNSDKITQRHCPKGVHGKINSMIIFVIRYTGVLLKYSCKPIFGQIAKNNSQCNGYYEYLRVTILLP